MTDLAKKVPGHWRCDRCSKYVGPGEGVWDLAVRRAAGPVAATGMADIVARRLSLCPLPAATGMSRSQPATTPPLAELRRLAMFNRAWLKGALNNAFTFTDYLYLVSRPQRAGHPHAVLRRRRRPLHRPLLLGEVPGAELPRARSAVPGGRAGLARPAARGHGHQSRPGRQRRAAWVPHVRRTHSPNSFAELIRRTHPGVPP